MNVGYMVIPVILFVGGIIVSTALFNAGMKRVRGISDSLAEVDWRAAIPRAAGTAALAGFHQMRA